VARTAVVTGATGAIGRAIATGLAQAADMSVVLACRAPVRGQKAAEAIQRQSDNSSIRVEQVDLSVERSVREFARRLESPVDILVNCAAVAPRQRSTTVEGLELQFATNVLGYLWMSLHLRDALRLATLARVVNVASYWAGGLDIADLQFERRPYDNDTAYRQSKQANRMLSTALARLWSDERISVTCCHPGDVHSTLSHSLGFGGSETPEQAARTPLWLALETGGLEQSGRYFEHQRAVECRFSTDREAVQLLFAKCAGFVSNI